ncbi:uncharacterized protein LOC109715704 isoform X2 [Ananas comosus]|uniref:Uncharacterized protein LOC109715704 isoform X2 n=1 Tax=Ananas comosus TaxID=4615 RepID=A0A6P5FJB7_ANACO|nr:uncharacterized protein LOC109715704 isoform X2 [Ananas comosus]
MEWWDRVAMPMRRVWIGAATRLRLRRSTGLWELRKEVSTCEYEDVRVMWEMLRKQHVAEEADVAASERRRGTRRGEDTWHDLVVAEFGDRERRSGGGGGAPLLHKWCCCRRF